MGLSSDAELDAEVGDAVAEAVARGSGGSFAPSAEVVGAVPLLGLVVRVVGAFALASAPGSPAPDAGAAGLARSRTTQR
ncbi:MAG: hypothetical protein U0263_33250 [Polyangiaceae bacterium]